MAWWNVYDSLVYSLCYDSQLPIDRMACVAAGVFGESGKKMHKRARSTNNITSYTGY